MIDLIKKYKNLPVQVKASLWFLICSFLQKGISMLTTPIFTRLLSTSEYGQFGVFNSWYSISFIIISLSLTSGVHTQGLVKFDNDKSVFSSSLQGLVTFLVIIWTCIYLCFHSFWDKLTGLTTFQMLLMIAMIWTSCTFGFWANEQRVKYTYKELVIITVIVSIAKPLIGIIFVLSAEDKVTARILGLLLVELLSYFWMFIYQIKSGKALFSRRYWSYALKFNIPLVPHYLSQTVLNGSDKIMIQRMIGDDEAGIYNLAYSLALIMTLFNTALMQTISPWMYQKIKQKREKDIENIAYITLIIIALVNLVVILFAPEIVAIFAPKSYYAAIWVVPPVAMSVFFMYTYDLFAKFAFYYEKTNFIMIASICGALLNIVLNYICLNKFGYIAAGYTTLVCYIIYSIAHYCFMKKVCKDYCQGRYPYNPANIIKIAVPFLAIGFLMLLTYGQPLIRYSLFAVMLVAAYYYRKSIQQMLKSIISLKEKQ